MAADKSDDPGVLGNLPRSRPGQRSAKRGGGDSAASPSTRARVAKAKTRAKAKSSTRAKAKPSTRAKSATARPKPTVSAASERPAATERQQRQEHPPAPEPQQQGGGGDPVTGAVKVAAKVATIGPRAAVGVAKRLLGR